MQSMKEVTFFSLPLLLVGGIFSEFPMEWTQMDPGRCPYTEAVEAGREKDHELKETSGLVASHKHHGVFYAIQDSLNPEPVYAINKKGDLLGI